MKEINDPGTKEPKQNKTNNHTEYYKTTLYP